MIKCTVVCKNKGPEIEICSEAEGFSGSFSDSQVGMNYTVIVKPRSNKCIN